MIYDDYSKAEFDLVLFSKMYKYEETPLYLYETGQGFTIENNIKIIEDKNLLAAIAINGVLFSRS